MFFIIDIQGFTHDKKTQMKLEAMNIQFQKFYLLKPKFCFSSNCPFFRNSKKKNSISVCVKQFLIILCL